MADTELASAENDPILMVLAAGHPSGITKLEKGTDKYDAATNLIGVGIDFDSCSAGPAETIMKLQDVPKKNPKYNVPKTNWAKSMRLDNQGDIVQKNNNVKYARLAVQTKNETNAQANVQIDVKFGQRGIRNAMQRSLDTAEVVLLSNNKEVIEKAQSLGHSVMTLEMCQALAEQEDD